MIFLEFVKMDSLKDFRKSMYYANLIGFIEGCESLEDEIWWCDSTNDELINPVADSYYYNYKETESNFCKIVLKIHAAAKNAQKIVKFDKSFINPFTEKQIEFYVCKNQNNKNYKFYFLNHKSLQYLLNNGILTKDLVEEYNEIEEKLIELFVLYNATVQSAMTNIN